MGEYTESSGDRPVGAEPPTAVRRRRRSGRFLPKETVRRTDAAAPSRTDAHLSPGRKAVRESRGTRLPSLRYGLGLCCGIGLALAGYLGALALLSGRTETYTTVHVGEWYLRKAEALSRTPSPRVVFLGGSNVLYGIDAESFQRTTGVRAVNAGTHAALHPNYFFEWVRRHARAGDLVVLSLEHHSFHSGEPTSIFANFLANRDLAAAWRLPQEVGGHALLAIDWDQLLLEAWRNATPSWKDGIAAGVKEMVAATVGPSGDYRGHSMRNQGAREKGLMAAVKPDEALAAPIPVDPVIVEGLRTLKRWCDRQGIRLVAVSPATLDFPAYHTETARVAQALYAETYRSIGIPLLEDASAEIRPRDEFFDSIYHLTYEAMQTHTERLARLLQPYLPR